jgi:pimeloyl-ACP methyl ester carboxylesterase
MIGTLVEMQEGSSWADWEALACPVLIVRSGRGVIDAYVVDEMAARLPAAEVIELPEARHDLHLDRPQEWRQALTAFLASVDGGLLT